MQFVVVNYTPDQAGLDILPRDVIRAANGRWYTELEVEHFSRKSRAGCPTYGTCTSCYSSGPVGLLCERCRTQFVVVHYHNTYDFADLIIDSENLRDEMNGHHQPARANRTIPVGPYNPPVEHWTEARVRVPDALRRITDVYTGPDGGPTVPQLIVKDYDTDQFNHLILNDDVVRAVNGKWYTEEEISAFWSKSVAECPTYGNCFACYASGPVGRHCGMHPNFRFCVFRYSSDQGYRSLLDAENVATVMNNADHTIARADLMFDWTVGDHPMYGVTKAKLRTWFTWKNERRGPRDVTTLISFWEQLFGINWNGRV